MGEVLAKTWELEHELQQGTLGEKWDYSTEPLSHSGGQYPAYSPAPSLCSIAHRSELLIMANTSQHGLSLQENSQQTDRDPVVPMRCSDALLAGCVPG